jgi:hypothetical protein
MSATVVSADALDLLVTAALRYGVLTSRTRNAFSPATAGVLQATPDDAGRVLLAQHLAAQRPTMAAPPSLSSELRCYQHVPVAHVDPVHVLKAIHTYEAVAAAGPGWDTSAAHTLTTALLRAAVKALPGYAEAPSSWRRPPVRSGPPIGLARTWRPIRDGVTWMTARELAAHWQSAAVVLLTVDALPDLPRGLPARDGVYVLAHGDLSPAAWEAIAESPALLIVQLPTGGTWLREELEAVSAGLRRPTAPALT